MTEVEKALEALDSLVLAAYGVDIRDADEVDADAESIRAALTEYAKLQSGDMVMVPREPTEEMVANGFAATGRLASLATDYFEETNSTAAAVGILYSVNDIYRAMIDAYRKESE